MPCSTAWTARRKNAIRRRRDRHGCRGENNHRYEDVFPHQARFTVQRASGGFNDCADPCGVPKFGARPEKTPICRRDAIFWHPTRRPQALAVALSGARSAPKLAALPLGGCGDTPEIRTAE